MKTEQQISLAAAEFAERWKDRGYERGESQPFWIDLLSNVFGIERPSDSFITFEEHNKVDASNFIDARIRSTKVLIEQKSLGVDLRAGRRQSDGAVLNPFQQARRYVVSLPVSEHPRWIVTCNFSEFLVYDMEQPNGEPEQILLENLGKEYYRLMFLVDAKSEHLSKEMRVSMQAGEIVGKIYDALLKQYEEPLGARASSPAKSADEDVRAPMLRWLNILCVRIVFCLYAEDAEVFSHDQFHDYLARFDAEGMRVALLQLFDTLNKPIDKRSRFLRDDLKAFPYTNGGLFEEEIEIPQFTEELRTTLLQNASLDFDWSEISPTIFGSVFESTLNPETRRSGGMHYTSIENIHKVIDSLFLNDLRRELDEILEEKIEKQRKRKLGDYQMKLSSLTFLDPACGSGNFLTETFLSLRRLENEAIREMYHGQTMLGAFVNPIKVSIQQFYGIEINDFAVTVATTALWISEAQMLRETEKIIKQDIDYLPLKPYKNIREGNALRMDWDVMEYPTDVTTIYAKNAHIIHEDESQWKASEPVVEYDDINLVTAHYDSEPKPTTTRVEVRFDYIIGNPPFVGYTFQSERQKEDLSIVCRECGKNIDYVAGWYYKAAMLMQHSNVKAALVSTNSICQGEQVSAIWKLLMEQYGLRIDFAYRTFQWDSEATLKAHVHCVIVGFSSLYSPEPMEKLIFNDNCIIKADNINPYLLDAPTVFVDKRKKPLCVGVPQMMKGSQPTDGGNLLLSSEEREELLKKSPTLSRYVRPFVGADEFIKGKERYCLWLDGANPDDLMHSAELARRIAAVRECRNASPKAATRQWAKFPTLFTENRQPSDTYIIVPSVSSEKRRYVPMGFVSPQVVASNLVLIIPNASLYHFGVLTSNIHMAWMRAICGRLEVDYRYSAQIVYNNFPWPEPTDAQKAKIEQTAQVILDVRAKYPNSTLAALYSENFMPADLLHAHEENDRAVMAAYGWKTNSIYQESMDVAKLFRLYQEMTNKV